MIRSLLHILIGTFVLFAGTLKAQQFNFQTWSIDDGLAQSQVFSMLTDSRGYLWLGTNGGGLSRFDGEGFKNFSKKDNLPGSYVYAIIEDDNGNLWIGTDKGLCVHDGLKFTPFYLDSLGVQTISCLEKDSDGTIWIGTASGLIKGENNTFSRENDLLPSGSNNKAVHSLFKDSRGNLWAGLENQIVRIGQNTEAWTYSSGYTGGRVYDISEDHEQNIWLATFRGAYRFDDTIFTRLTISDGLPSNFVQAVFTDDKNNIWLGFQNRGIAIYNHQDSTITSLSENDGLSKNDVRCLSQDRWGNVWIGSSGGGISKYSGQQFEHFNRTNKLVANRIYAIFQDTSGNLLISASNRGFSEITDSILIHHGASTDFIDVAVKALFKDSNGNTWVGTEGKGLATIDSSGYLLFSENLGLAGNWVKDILEDKEGNLWVATNDGISKIIVTKDTLGVTLDIKNFDKNSGINNPYTYDLHLDTLDRIWAALRFGGLICIEDDTIKHHFQSNDGLVTNNIRSITEDSTGLLWIGTGDQGIAKINLYEDTLSVSFPEVEKLYSENVYSLILDDEQNLWVGSQQGVDKISFTDDRNLKDVQHFGRAEGFAGIENCTNAVWKDGKGNLWFGTMNGLTKYNANFQNNDTIPPLVRFTNISLEYTPLRETPYAHFMDNWGQVKDSLQLPWQKNDLTFEFNATDLSAPLGMKYQYRLLGIDEEWGPEVENNIVRFANLSPGNYTFQVMSINSNKVLSKNPAQFSFTINAPFWQKRWFPWAAAGLFLIIASLIFRTRYVQLKKRSQRKEQQLSLEKKMLELEQKALQLQMNPHFIFNTLNSIQGLISQKDPKKARFYLAKFSRLMRSVLENSRSERIPLEDEIETLDHYLSLEQFGKNDSFEYNITVDPEIEVADLMIPPLMVQPFVENAIVHGISTLEGQGKIAIEFNQNEQYLSCTITDNGIGREASARQKSQKDAHHKSMGLQVTAERLELLNEHQGESFLIEDVTLSDGTVKGTRVHLKFKIEF